MKRLREIIDKLPAWLPTVVTVLLICWLTLAPRPLGEVELPLFPGADKILHGLMFGFLVIVILLDLCRTSGWKSVSLPIVSLVALGSALFGIIIEFLQQMMQTGRTLEILDMLADVTGAIICAAMWLVIQPAIVKGKEK